MEPSSGFLPALSNEQRRLWLPKSQPATVVIGRMLTATVAIGRMLKPVAIGGMLAEQRLACPSPCWSKPRRGMTPSPSSRRQLKLFFCTATCRPVCSLDGAVCLVPIEKGAITEALAYIKNCDPKVVDAEDHTDSFLWGFVAEACDCLYLGSCSSLPLEGR